MLPCLNKKLFGLDCLGCGFQRSLVHLFKGEFSDAFQVYPAIFTLVLLLVFFLINSRIKFKKGRKIMITFAIINVLIIITSYFIKMKPLFIN
jgi:hypothetical protein